jgi:phosphopantetheinyl transferase (holo-ACP synthase)
VERAADRWLSAEERVWCCSQTSLAEALLVVLCCKEAAFKAWSEGTAAHEVRLDLRGSTARGRGSARHSPVAVEVEWRRLGQRVIALAVATAPRP